MAASIKITIFWDAKTAILMRSEVPMKVTTTNTVFWDVTPCTLVEGYTGLGGGRQYTP
jgi:hypothetical protein